MFSWEQQTTRFLDTIGLRSIRIKIIAFALVATLIPSLTLGWLSYRNNRQVVDEKIEQRLASLATQASDPLNLWIRERRNEMQVFSGSYEVTRNLQILNSPAQQDRVKAQARLRLKDYLRSVSEKFAHYEVIVVLDVRGNPLTASLDRSGPPGLTGDWFDRLRTGGTVLGKAHWDKTFNSAVLPIAEPIHSDDGTFLGAMSAKANLGEVESSLGKFAKDPLHEIYLTLRGGEILFSSRGIAGPFLALRLAEDSAADLFARESPPLPFRGFRGTEVLGVLRAIPDLDWGVVVERDRREAYSAIIGLRNRTLSLIATLLIAIGLAAYLLGLTIVGPLTRLTLGARKVSGGDLDVNLPIHGRSEVSYLTGVFNEMVTRLRKFRDENVAINEELRQKNETLRTQSITDVLTGLYNRTELSELLGRELARSTRHKHPFSILMIDIDRFKRFNDSHGHPAGDELLRRVAKVLKRHIRTSDVAARYGGEEFLILMSETGPEGSLCFAEKLRDRVEAIKLEGGESVTVSIGVASFPDHGNDVESIIKEADIALYACKKNGRNRVALAGSGRKGVKQARVSSG